MPDDFRVQPPRHTRAEQLSNASGAEALHDVVRSLRRRGIEVVVQGMTAAQVRTAKLMDAAPAERFVRSLPEAITVAAGLAGAQ